MYIQLYILLLVGNSLSMLSSRNALEIGDLSENPSAGYFSAIQRFLQQSHTHFLTCQTTLKHFTSRYRQPAHRHITEKCKLLFNSSHLYTFLYYTSIKCRKCHMRIKIINQAFSISTCAMCMILFSILNRIFFSFLICTSF